METKNKFQCLTFEQFCDEHRNQSLERIAYQLYLDNLTCANILWRMQEQVLTVSTSGAEFSTTVAKTIHGLNQVDGNLIKTAKIQTSTIRDLIHFNWISVAIHILTWGYILIALKGK